MLRKVPGALALGLLASLLGHTLLFGTDHAMGGEFHATLVILVFAAGTGLLTTFAALAWAGTSQTADGSVLGVRLNQRLPGLGAIFPTSVVFFAIGESLEPPHVDQGIITTLFVLLAASWVVSAIARAAVKTLAEFAIAIVRTRFAAREPIGIVFSELPVIVRRAPMTRRRFARPPPTTTTLAHA